VRQVIYPDFTITPSLPINYKDVTAFCKDGLQYKTREVFKLELLHTFIFSTGLIYKPFSLLPESAIHETWFQEKNMNWYSPVRILKDLIRKRIRILPVKEKYVSLFDEWSSNHYHLHVDLLPRLLFLNKSDLTQLTLILPDKIYIKESIHSILNIFGFTFKKVLFIKPNEIFFVKHCLFISKTATTGLVHAPLMLQLKERLSIPKNMVIKFPKRLYVKRKNTTNRIVLNGEIVEKVLKENYGFESVDFDAYKIEDQAKLAADAEIMVGMHGAGLTNILYMPKGGKLVEFRRDGIHLNHCYWHLASSIGIEYSIVFGEPDEKSKVLEGLGCNLTIDINQLKTVLDKVLAVNRID